MIARELRSIPESDSLMNLILVPAFHAFEVQCMLQGTHPKYNKPSPPCSEANAARLVPMVSRTSIHIPRPIRFGYLSTYCFNYSQGGLKLEAYLVNDPLCENEDKALAKFNELLSTSVPIDYLRSVYRKVLTYHPEHDARLFLTTFTLKDLA